MINYSDMSRSHRCASDTVRQQDLGTLVNREGNVMRRAQ